MGNASLNNPAVKRTMAQSQKKYGAKKATPTQKSLVNKMAIMTLSKQVTQLQRSKLGAFQTCRLRTGFQISIRIYFNLNGFYLYRGTPVERSEQAPFAQIILICRLQFTLDFQLQDLSRVNSIYLLRVSAYQVIHSRSIGYAESSL